VHNSFGKLHEFGAEKPISQAKPAHFDFFAINFTVWSHILSTVGDALRKHAGVKEVNISCFLLLHVSIRSSLQAIAANFKS